MENVIKALKKIIRKGDKVLIEEMSWDISGSFYSKFEYFNEEINEFVKKRLPEEDQEAGDPFGEMSKYTSYGIIPKQMENYFKFYLSRISFLKIIEMFREKMRYIVPHDDDRWDADIEFIYDNKKYSLSFYIDENAFSKSVELSIKTDDGYKTLAEWEETR